MELKWIEMSIKEVKWIESNLKDFNFISTKIYIIQRNSIQFN